MITLCSPDSYKDSEHTHQLRKFPRQISLCSSQGNCSFSYYLLRVDFVSSWTSYTWNLTMRTPLCKTSVIPNKIFEIRPWCCGCTLPTSCLAEYDSIV